MKRILILFLLSLLANNFLNAQADDYMPLLREGVKWVYYQKKYGLYEDEFGSRFYTIEVKGDTVVEGRTYKKCYRYTDVDWTDNFGLKFSKTEPVALLREEGRTVYAYNRDAAFYHTLDAMEEFKYWSMDDWYFEERDVKFIQFDENDHFKFEGYKQFQGKQCEMYSFTDNYGISSNDYEMGFFIEGIGLDSDIYGDMLNPYYTLPFCSCVYRSDVGLHHMEDANDNIIYRGKAFTQDHGDVNGDEKIDVEDVNAVINIILKLKTVADYPGNGDMNGDGVIDVEDVNAIINIILKVE